MCWPTSLGDASAPTCDLEEHIKKGLRVSSGAGRTGGSNAATTANAFPSRIAALIADPACRKPKIAVVCLQYGAQNAADVYGLVCRRFCGLHGIVCPVIFARNIVPALKAINDGRANDIPKALMIPSRRYGLCTWRV